MVPSNPLSEVHSARAASQTTGITGLCLRSPGREEEGRAVMVTRVGLGSPQQTDLHMDM
jgi:hypothetical protein